MDASTTNKEHVQYARDMINSRTERLQQLKRIALEQGREALNAAGGFKAYKEGKEVELKAKLETARAQQVLDTNMVVPYLERQQALRATQGTVHKVKEVVQDTVDVLKVQRAKFQETRDFAYDAVYSWKQTAQNLQQTAQEKTVEAVKGVQEVVSEKAVGAIEWVAGNLEEVQEKVHEAKEVVHDMIETAKDTVAKRERVAAETEEAKVDMVVQQLQQLGDDVVRKVVSRLGVCDDVCKKMSR